jgi:hypothetical protein
MEGAGSGPGRRGSRLGWLRGERSGGGAQRFRQPTLLCRSGPVSLDLGLEAPTNLDWFLLVRCTQGPPLLPYVTVGGRARTGPGALVLAICPLGLVGARLSFRRWGVVGVTSLLALWDGSVSWLVLVGVGSTLHAAGALTVVVFPPTILVALVILVGARCCVAWLGVR